MAGLIRSAKSGSDWTTSDLCAYNITIHHQTARQFFGDHFITRSIDHLDPYLLRSSRLPVTAEFSTTTRRLLYHLDLASRLQKESHIDDFGKAVLQLFKFDQIGTSVCLRHQIPLTICGDPGRAASTDVCLMHVNTTILLVIQEDKILTSAMNPEPQLIAEAIAAYQWNNRMRTNKLNLQTLDVMTIPCITMVGTWPTFYLGPSHQGAQHLCRSGRIS